MSDIQIIPYDNKTGRVETGAVQFGEDWPGLFIRGDNCMGYMMHVMTLEHALADNKEFHVQMALSSLRSIFGEPLNPPPNPPKESEPK